jgi:hypothetical protein
MRILAILFLLFTSCGARAESIFPENDLHLYDNLNSKAGIDESTFGQVIAAGEDSYRKAEAVQRNEKLIVNRKWNEKIINANVNRDKKYEGTVEINMYGGLARRQEITPAGFAIVLCHELGHAYAGAPYVYTPTELSAEGLADWYSTRHCLKRVWERVPTLQKLAASYEPFIEENCVPGDSLCRNGLEGARGLTNLLGFILGDDELAAFETPDPFETDKTILSYPKTVQCRLDSYAAGVFAKLKPVCWFKY